MRSRIFAIFLVLIAAFAVSSASAAEFRVLLDKDYNPATGCAVATASGNFTGVEEILTTSVNTTAYPATVTGVTRQTCVTAPSTFSAPITVETGSWPVGLGVGVGGYDAIETYYPSVPEFGRWRLGFMYQDGALADAVVAGSGGGSLGYLFGVAPIPTMGTVAMAILSLLLGVAAFLQFRKSRSAMMLCASLVFVLVVAPAWAAIAVVLDGQVGDWSDTPAFVQDVVGDSPPGSDVSAIFLKSYGGKMYFRADVKTAAMPVAANDTFGVNSGTPLSIPATPNGLLANDTLGGPPATMTFFGGGNASGSITSVPGSTLNFGTGGALTVNADGSFNYTPSTGFTGPFVFNYRITNIVGSSDGQVTINVNEAPAITSAGTTSFTVGVPNTFTISTTGFPSGASMVLSQTGALPGGVTFTDNHDGTATLAGTPNAGTVAAYPLTITANNGIGSAFNQSFNLNVGKANSVSNVAASPNPSVVGQSVTFTATITTSAAAGASPPTGTVTFLDGVTPLASGVPLVGGVATFSTSALTLGAHSITVTHSGDGNLNGSTSTVLSFSVNQAASVTSVTSSLNPSVNGQSVTFSATVAATGGASGTPTGTVTFLDGVTPLASNVTLVGGAASFSTGALGAGSHSITVAYNGDANFGTSTSSALTQTVNKAATATSVTAVPNPSVFGQSVTMTATVSVTAPGAGTPTGAVTFRDGVTVLGTSALAGSTATLSTSALSTGLHGSITATYDGDANFNTSASSNFSQTINQAATVTMLTSGLNPSLAGNNVTFTAAVAAVAPGSGIPTGSITFSIDGAPQTPAVMSSGQATFSTSALTPGSHTIAATYGGDSNFTTSSGAPLTQIVNQAPAAVADGYSTVHGIPLVVPASGVLSNDGLGFPAAAITSMTGNGAPCTVFPCTVTTTSGGSATLQTDGSFSYTPLLAFAGTDTFAYNLNNVVGNSPATVTITVTDLPPVVDLNGAIAGIDFGPVTFTEAGPAVAVVGTVSPDWLTITDGDGTTLDSATITVSNVQDGLAETINLTCPTGPAPDCSGAIKTTDIVQTAAAGTYTLTITKPAQFADYEALLRSLTYNNSSLNPTVAPNRDITVTVNDGIVDNTPLAHAFVSVVAVNTAPTVTAPATATTPPDTPKVFSGTISVADADAGASAVTLTLTSVNGTAALSGTSGLTVSGNGTALVTATGTLTDLNTALNGATFTPTTGFTGGGASLKIDIDDLGNTGIGGALTGTATVAITVNQPPFFTSANTASFTAGSNGTFTVTAGGAPAPSLSMSGTPPAGVSFTPGTGILAGTPGVASGGTYPLTFTASNGIPSDATQNFTLTVTQAPAITSAASTTFVTGSAGSFAVTVTGFPVPTVAISGCTLPSGVSFAANTLSGTAGAGTGGVYNCVLTASNGVGSNAVQNFALTVNQAPAITSANNFTFTTGVADSFSVTATGFPAPTIAISSCTLPTGVTFTPGTGALAGTPGAGTGGAYNCVFTASNGVGSNAVQNFTLTVNQPPSITSAAATTFVTGSAGNFSVTTTGFPVPTVAISSCTLPTGVTFSGNSLSGTAAGGTGGVYNCVFTASNGVGSNATQNFTFTVNQPAVVTSANNATFETNVPGTFTATATGFPAPTLAISGCTLPTGVTFTPGTGVLAGTPAAATGGIYNCVFTASNGVGSNGTQNFALTVNQPPAITSTNAATFVSTGNNTFTVNTTGFPTNASMVISESGTLPGGITFVNNNNGTATISGTPSPAGSVYLSSPYSLTITASNGVGTNAVQAYTLTVLPPPPVATNDTNTATGGLSINVSAPGVLSNDTLYGATITSYGAATGDEQTGIGSTTPTAQGGSVTLNADGSYTYETPSVGTVGTDTFKYRLTNTGGTAVGTVTITISDNVLFVDSSVATSGNGHLATPFKLMSDLPAAGARAPAGTKALIYVQPGSGSYGSVVLGANDALIGRADGLSSALGFAGITAAANTVTASFPVAGTAPTLAASGGAAVTLDNSNVVRSMNISISGAGTGITASSKAGGTIANVPISQAGGGTGSALSLTSHTGTASVTNSPMTCQSSAAGTCVNISGATGTGTISFVSSPITQTVGKALNVGGKTSGTLSFDAASDITVTAGTTDAITLITNTGSTINFVGTLNLTTSGASARGFVATGGGTISATDASNVVTAVGSTALHVADTSIGASGLTFRHISANGGPNGIFLQNTGAAGGLSVIGDNANTAKGGNASGGTIQNMVGADGATAGNGIYLDNTQKVSLRRMQLNGFQNSAIRGQTVTDFTLQYSKINGTSGDNSGATEGAVTFGTVSGTNGLAGGINLLDNNQISGAIEHNLEFYNHQAGSNYSLTISNSDIKSNSVGFGGDGIQIELGGGYASTATVSIQSVSFDDNKSQGVQASALANSNLDITINQSTLLGTTQGNEGFILQNGGNANLTAHVTNNNLSGIDGTAIFVGQVAGNATPSSDLTAVIKNNTVTHATTATNHAIISFLTSTIGQSAPANILIEGNTVTQNSTSATSRAILVDTPDTSTSPSFTATVINNNVSVGDNVGGVVPIVVQARQSSAGCFDIRNNVATFPNGTPGGVVGVRARQAAPATANIEAGVSASSSALTVLDDNHSGATTEVLGTITVVGNSTCANAPT